MEPVDLVLDQEVSDGDTVVLSVVIGNGQLGGSIVELGNKTLAKGAIINLPIGTGAKLKGKTLWVKTVVSDVNDKTDLTIVTYDLSLNGNIRSTSIQALAETPGGAVAYRCEINFV